MAVQPAVLFVIGASGTGKTVAVRALERRGIADLRCYHFDSVGVPHPELMIRDLGSPEAWQEATTRRWVDRFATNADAAGLAVLDGQTRPSYLRAAVAHSGLEQYRIVLLDCASDIRRSRLADRGQPALASTQMDMWAAYLRGGRRAGLARSYLRVLHRLRGG